MIKRRRSQNNSTNNYSKVHDTASNDDVRYFIEKIKNKSLNVFSGDKADPVSNIDNLEGKPPLFKNYIHFLARYVRFTLSNITDTYDVIVSEWMAKNPFLVDKIKFVDSSNIKSVISDNVIDYAERKLRPGIINSVINRTFTDDEAAKIWVNMETYNPPALAFLGPPGTAKTNAITSALASLAQGGENRLIWDWLRYDITTHEVTTAPLVLPVASDVVTDNPLTTVALMRSTGNREIDIALTENVQTKTLSKAIATFAYILKGGHENKLIELRPEVQQQINNNVVLSSLKLETWKFITTKNIDANNIDEITRPLIDALSTRLKGFKAIVEAIDTFAKNNQSNSDWIDYIVSGRYLDQSVKNRLAVAEKYANDFRELCHLLSDLIVFGLTPVIANTFMNFFMNMKESENNKEKIENGFMYIYHKIHNDYLHRIISRIFLLYALFNISKEQNKISDLFAKLINILQDGLETMLKEYVKWISSESNQEYYDLEAEYKNDIPNIGKNKYIYYNNFNKFLLKMESNSIDEEYRYRKIDALFIENVLSRFDVDIKQMREFSATSQGYKTSKIASKSYDRVAEGGSDRHFGANRLSFVDEISIITDTINDVDEINKYYSNSPNSDLRTTAQRLGDSFGRRFLNLADNDASTVPYPLSVVFSFIYTLVNLYNTDAGKIKWKPAKYEDDIIEFKDSLETLFRKSLSIITSNPKIGFITGNENSMEEPQSKNIDIFEIVADYVLARLGVVESVYTPGAVYSFPAPIQVFLKKARDSYIKALNETKIDNVRLPMYVLFIDEILTKLTKQDFTFWLNIWNGLVSPNTDINQALPPNVCFIVAGNMPKDWRLLEQALLQRAVVELEEPEDDRGTKTSYGPSADTLNALGSRINLYIVTYDYSYLMQTDDSTIKKRTNLFITSLVDEVLNNAFSNNILLDTAINIIGGFYDYYKVIVSERLSAVKEQNNEELARLHAYIASLTARANITPYDINNVEHNRTISQLIKSEHASNITSTTYKDILDKATKLNYLFNSTVFGKSTYKHMLIDYFKSNKHEAIYFKRMITLVLSPVVLHLSFLHAYLTWNNMMRNIADDLFNMGSNVFDADKASYYENIMKIIKDSAVLINFNMTTKDALSDKLELMKNNDYEMDRIVNLIFEREGSIDLGTVLSESKDIRYCHPYVGAFIGLLTIAFYNYIKYMKKFNSNISNSISSLCSIIKSNISDSLGKNDLAKNNFYVLGININNYFIDEDRKRKDIIFEKSKKTSDNAVEIKVIVFDKGIYHGELKTSRGVAQMPYERKGLVYTDAIAVKIQKTGEGDNDINKKDIDAIKALVEYTFYTYVYKMREGNFDSASLVNYVLGSSGITTPIVTNLMASFFSSPKEGHAFTVEPLREMDRWFTNVSSSVVRYVTIMFILKHILTYEQDASSNNKSNLIVSFMNSIKANMDEINSNIKNDFDSLIREFASLLYRYKEAVFTPLAGDNQEFRMFSYDYYDMSGRSKKYDGYYMNPRNLINFGDLSFISKNLKGSNIIEVISGGEGTYIQEIAAKFVNNLKEKDTIPITFLPIHLVSHLDNKEVISPTKQKMNLLSGSIVRLVLGQAGKGRIEQDAFRFLLEPIETELEPIETANDPRIEFYKITYHNCQICDILKVLSNSLKGIDKEQFQDLAPIIQELLDINSTIQTTWNDKNLIKALEATNEGYENIQTASKSIDDGIFTELRRSQRKYPSVKRYLDLWDHKETQKNIKDFFDNMLVVLRKRSADKDTYYANKLINTLNTYIQQAAQKIDGIIELDENNKALQKIKNLLSTLKEDSSQLDENIKIEIASIIDEIYAKNQSLIEIQQYRNEVIERNFKILNPIIKYSFAILLSNMLLKVQYGELQDYLTNIDNSFKASYKKVSSIDDYENKEYFNIFVRYMFYDINRRDIGNENKEIDLDVQLVVRYDPITSSSSVNGFPLVTPVFTGSANGKANVELEGNTIKGRRVYTQYEYIENNNGVPTLYCDVHHMPIKGTRDVDGFLYKVETTIDIASNDKDAKSGKKHIAYKDIMFLRDWAEPRYAFTPSALVNALLIIGTYLVQNTLLGDKVDLKFVNRFLPFVITNMYEYYKDGIEANGADKAGVETILKNISENIYKRPIHPLVAAIALALNRDDEKIKERLKEDYAIRDSNESNTYSRRDSFMRDLRLRFYSVQKVSAVNYNMYSLYEPGIVIISKQQSQNEQHA
jgi:hypothetical protein